MTSGLRPLSAFVFLAAIFQACSASATILRFLPFQGGEDLLLAGGPPASDSLGRSWLDPHFAASGWSIAERDWHPHWCGGGIINPLSDEAPLCATREGLGGGFVPWITPDGLGWTLDLRQVVVHRKVFYLPGSSEGLLGRVLLWATADDIPEFYINGVQLDHRANGYGAWGFWDVTSLVKPGRNVLASHVIQMNTDSPCALTYLLEAEFQDRAELVLAPVGTEPSISSRLTGSWPSPSEGAASGPDSSDSSHR